MPLMTVFATLLSLFKSGKHLLSVLLSACRKVLCFVWENKSLMVIILLLYIATTQKNDISRLQVALSVEKGNYVLLQQQHNNDLLKLEKQSKQLEIDRLLHEQELEDKHNEKINKILHDSNSLNAVNHSLSDALTKAANKLQSVSDSGTTSDKALAAYANTATKLFGDCRVEYSEMAKNAQRSRIAEEHAVSKYNALGGVTPDTDNKEK